MSTIVLQQPGEFITQQTETPPRGAGEALVRVHRVGICGTDLHAYKGRQPFFQYPRILGHELGVEIVEVDENGFGISVGDRCAVEPYLNCGQCIACRRGKTNCCESLRVMGVHIDGGMREYLSVPVHKLHKSLSLPFEQLALVETLGIGAHAVHRAQPQAGENALVIGCGPIGLTVMAFARQRGANLIAMDMNEQRLAFCRENMGVQHTVIAGENSLDEVKERLDGELPTTIFDCTGNSTSMHNAFQYCANGGALVFVGLFKGEVSFHDPEFHRREMTLYATRNSTGDDFKRIIHLLEASEVDVSSWISVMVPHTEMIERFPSWTEPESGIIKAVVEW